MATLHEDGDRISLSQVDTRILIALLLGRQNGYGIAKRCQLDNTQGTLLSNGALIYSLNSLIGLNCVKLTAPKSDGARVKLYELTPFGREMIKSELDSLQNLVKLGIERHRRP